MTSKIVLSFLLLLITTSAIAQKPPSPYYEEAQVLYENGDYEGAIHVWLIDINPHDGEVVKYFNVAQAYRHMGHDATALWFYRMYVMRVGPCPGRDKAERWVTSLSSEPYVISRQEQRELEMLRYAMKEYGEQMP